MAEFAAFHNSPDFRGSHDVKTIKLMLLGKTGHGKSSTGNSILMKEDFLGSDKGESMTQEFQLGATRIGDIDLQVIDTRGLCDTSKDKKDVATKKVLEDLEGAMSLCTEGVDCFILVLNYAGHRYTDEEESAVNDLRRIFTDEMFKKYLIVLFTHKDNFQKEQRNKKGAAKETWLEWCRKQDGRLKDLFQLCNYRSIIFENLYDFDDDEETPSEKEIEKHRKQRKELFEMINKIRSDNQNKRYTSDWFDKAAENRQRMQEESNYQVIHPDVLFQYSILRDRLGAVLSSTNLDGEMFLFQIDKIKDDAIDVLEFINSHNNKFGFLDQIKVTIKDFIENSNSKADVEQILKKMNASDSSFREKLGLSGFGATLVNGLSKGGEALGKVALKKFGTCPQALLTAGEGALALTAGTAVTIGAAALASAGGALGFYAYYQYKKYKKGNKLKELEEKRQKNIDEYKTLKKSHSADSPDSLILCDVNTSTSDVTTSENTSSLPSYQSLVQHSQPVPKSRPLKPTVPPRPTSLTTASPPIPPPLPQSRNLCTAAPPPPSPSPCPNHINPETSNPSNGRHNLLEAIRQAGGVEGAKLKSFISREDPPLSGDYQTSLPSSDRLIDEMKNKVKLRRVYNDPDSDDGWN